MKALSILAGLIFATSTSFAGGIVGFPETEMTVCKGDTVAIAAHKTKSGVAQSVDDVLKGNGTLVRAYDSVVINELLGQKLIYALNWDKTNWYKGIGLDIEQISDHVTFVFEGGRVSHIGGGNIEYNSAIALVGNDYGKLPKTSVGQKLNRFLNIALNNNGYGEFSLVFNVITGATQKCVKTKTIPNPYHLDGDSSPELIEVCDQFEQVTPVVVDTVLEQHFAVSPSCSIEKQMPL